MSIEGLLLDAGLPLDEHSVNVYTVRDNLVNTIAGKEAYLAEIGNINAMKITSGEAMALAATSKFLKINIEELRQILTDLEICCMKATEASWAGAVDRQGGAFEESELRGRDGWL